MESKDYIWLYTTYQCIRDSVAYCINTKWLGFILLLDSKRHSQGLHNLGEWGRKEMRELIQNLCAN